MVMMPPQWPAPPLPDPPSPPRERYYPQQYQQPPFAGFQQQQQQQGLSQLGYPVPAPAPASPNSHGPAIGKRPVASYYHGRPDKHAPTVTPPVTVDEGIVSTFEKYSIQDAARPARDTRGVSEDVFSPGDARAPGAFKPPSPSPTAPRAPTTGASIPGRSPSPPPYDDDKESVVLNINDPSFMTYPYSVWNGDLFIALLQRADTYRGHLWRSQDPSTEFKETIRALERVIDGYNEEAFDKNLRKQDSRQWRAYNKMLIDLTTQ
jgi:hypothetical protein